MRKQFSGNGKFSADQKNGTFTLEMSELIAESPEEFIHIGIITMYDALEVFVRKTYGRKESLDELIKQMKAHIGYSYSQFEDNTEKEQNKLNRKMN